MECLGEPWPALYTDEAGVSLLAKAILAGPVRIIFLDVDGVLNCRSFTGSADEGDGSDLLNRECVEHLGTALEASGALVVLTSTWRSSGDLRSVIHSALEELCPGCMVGQTGQHPSWRNDMRPREIAEFLSDAGVQAALQNPGSAWCAVDDMDLLKQATALAQKKDNVVRGVLPALKDRFVRTNKTSGLDAASVDSILKAS